MACMYEGGETCRDNPNRQCIVLTLGFKPACLKCQRDTSVVLILSCWHPQSMSKVICVLFVTERKEMGNKGKPLEVLWHSRRKRDVRWKNISKKMEKKIRNKQLFFFLLKIYFRVREVEAKPLSRRKQFSFTGQTTSLKPTSQEREKLNILSSLMEHLACSQVCNDIQSQSKQQIKKHYSQWNKTMEAAKGSNDWRDGMSFEVKSVCHS